MARTFPLLRRLGAALAALVLAVLVLGPSLDGLMCRDEGGLAAAAATVHADAAVHADNAGPDEHGPDGAMPCVHGHCHHAGAYMTAGPLEAAAPAEHAGRLPLPAADRNPPSGPAYGLKRPPRA